MKLCQISPKKLRVLPMSEMLQRCNFAIGWPFQRCSTQANVENWQNTPKNRQFSRGIPLRNFCKNLLFMKSCHSFLLVHEFTEFSQIIDSFRNFGGTCIFSNVPERQKLRTQISEIPCAKNDTKQLQPQSAEHFSAKF